MIDTALIEEFKRWHDEEVLRLQEKGKLMVLHYFGSFKEDLIYRLSETIEEKLLASDFSYTVVKKVFSSVTEAINNIIKHGEKAESSTGALSIYTKENIVKIAISNIVTHEKSKTIKLTIDELNTLSRKDMNMRFYDLMKRSIVSNTSSLGIGILSIRLNSSSSLRFNFHKLNDKHTIFSLQFEMEALTDDRSAY